jgi:8-oxo-dGTP pyrophosphatase MutT (NUDIX family)
MALTSIYIGASGVKYIFEYEDADSFAHLDPKRCTQTYGVAFCGNDIVIGFGGNKNDWGLIGGTIEAGETFEQTLAREIQEESNMEVLSAIPVGYQKVTDTRDGQHYFQLRYACKVRPLGPFTGDPDGGIKEIKLIDPKEYKKYFDWGEIGKRIISRAIELKSKL